MLSSSVQSVIKDVQNRQNANKDKSLHVNVNQRDSVRWNEVVKKLRNKIMTKKISLIFFFLFFIQYFIGYQSNMLAKGVKFYVGKLELSDMKISLRLTIEDNRNGTLNISKWIKSKRKKYKIVEFYFTSFEADTLILSGELLYDIKYLVKEQKRSCFIYPINSLPDGVLFCDENTKRIELIEKKHSNK